MTVNRLGLDCVLAYDANGESATYATPTWTTIAYAKDVSVPLSKATADVTTRAANGWRQRVGTLKEGNLQFQYKYVPGDAVFDDLYDSYENGTRLLCFVADGPVATSGTEGLKIWCEVTKLDIQQELENAMMFDVEMVIADSAAAQTPDWITVA